MEKRMREIGEIFLKIINRNAIIVQVVFPKIARRHAAIRN